MLPSIFYLLKGEVTICKSLQLKQVSCISCHPVVILSAWTGRHNKKHQLEHIAVVRLTRECDQELTASKWHLGGNKGDVTSNHICRDPLEWESEPGLQDSKGLPLEGWGARMSLKNRVGKGSSQERDKDDELCTKHWRCGYTSLCTRQ
jgi:hypothetical protein